VLEAWEKRSKRRHRSAGTVPWASTVALRWRFPPMRLTANALILMPRDLARHVWNDSCAGCMDGILYVRAQSFWHDCSKICLFLGWGFMSCLRVIPMIQAIGGDGTRTGCEIFMSFVERLQLASRCTIMEIKLRWRMYYFLSWVLVAEWSEWKAPNWGLTKLNLVLHFGKFDGGCWPRDAVRG